MNYRPKTACFTGHRIISEKQIRAVKQALKGTLTLLIEKGYCYFGAGGALGFDYEKRMIM